MVTYDYSALSSLDHIRVLVLEPGSFDDPIKCSLKQIPIDGAEGEYEGISYSWGRDEEFTDIECDGKKLTVKANLADALRVFRRAVEPRAVIWADAVCINQKDHAEKGYQVRRMGEVYQKASRVLCWLGKDDEQIARDCFALVREANQVLTQQWQDGWIFTNLIQSLDLLSVINNDTRARWLKFKSLLELSWFECLWVVQEAGLARECTMFWGEEEIEFYEIIELASWFAYFIHAPAPVDGVKIGRVPVDVFLDI
ncbi:heterokaryon incompatibility protein-domain-containing protein [Xylariaceae sp. FL0804]|nr:heterokaryon incompatibility protein-domain-containing protein [Xylariaceae sp. FL0804]